MMKAVRHVLPFVLAVLALPACQRPQRTIGRAIEAAGVIAIADVAAMPGQRVALTVREILKGAAPRTVVIQRSFCPHLADGKGRAVLLTADWRSNSFPLVEVYTEPGQVARLRELVPLYRLSERQRLDALRADSRYREQLFDDLREMREPANYAVVTGMYPNLDTAGRLKLIELIGYIGDPRGVPVLLEALNSDSPELREAARGVLAFSFPEAAPGSVLRPPRTPENAMQRAFRLAREGRRSEARPLLFAVAADNRESDQIRLWAALELAPRLDAQSKKTLRRIMLPLLSRIVREGNYLLLADAVSVLRELRDAGNLELLVQALARQDFIQQRTPFGATMAIREMGPSVQPRAVDLLAARLDASARESGYNMVGGAPPALLLALAWLGGEPEFERTRKIRGDYLHAIWGAGRQPREGAFLTSVLSEPRDLPPEAIEWIAMRLGDLKDLRAIDPLIAMLASSQWNLAEASKEALMHIGGDQVAAAATRVLSGNGPAGARQAALSILESVNGARALPQVREAMADKALRTTALFLLARIGAAEDLKILIPMADFWSGDREVHYWAMQAVGEIRALGRQARVP
jgi:HEAT repeat protein